MLRHRTNRISISVGTYDGGLIGYDIIAPKKACENMKTLNQQKYCTFRLNPVFALTPHLGCVRCIASRGKFLVTSSSDQNIRLYSLACRSEIGTLDVPNRSCVSMKFAGENTLLTVHDDFSLSLWRCSDWVQLAKLSINKPKLTVEAPRNRTLLSTSSSRILTIAGVSVHPSGCIAIVGSKSGHIQLWNLLNAELSATFEHSLDSMAEDVCWCAAGDMYAILSKKSVVIQDIKTRKMIKISSLDGVTDCTWTSVCFVSETYILLGNARGFIFGVSLDFGIENSGKQIELGSFQEIRPGFLVVHRFKGNHRLRVKGISLIHLNMASQIAAFVSADSGGILHVWCCDFCSRIIHPVNDKTIKTISPLDTIDAKCRITCLASNYTFEYNPKSENTNVKIFEPDITGEGEVYRASNKRKKRKEQIKKTNDGFVRNENTPRRICKNYEKDQNRHFRFSESTHKVKLNQKRRKIEAFELF